MKYMPLPLTPVDALLDVAAHVLGELAEQLPEQARQQGPPQVQALVRVVVPVILLPPAQRHLADNNVLCLSETLLVGPVWSKVRG